MNKQKIIWIFIYLSWYKNKNNFYMAFYMVEEKVKFKYEMGEY